MSLPNYFQLNYNLGRTHSGMIAYLAELWNAGRQKPFQNFLKSIGASPFIDESTGLPYEVLKPMLEYKGIDLMIWNKADDGKKDAKPLLVIEMKVDDHESVKKVKNVWTR